ncbi:MAG TPA: heavy metal-binding domain-containing protein [Polyangiaceae bacterium]
MNQAAVSRPALGLSDLSVTEFLTLSRMGFLPHGLVVGAAMYDAGLAQLAGMTREVSQLSHAMRAARWLAVTRMRDQASRLHAEGVVGVRLLVEHHRWRGGHQVAKFIALGTAVAFDPTHCPAEMRAAPPLRLADGRPFTSALSGQDFVTLLRAGYRPVSVAVGCCVYELNGYGVWPYAQANRNEEIAEFTQALFDAREVAMERMTQDLFAEFGLAGAHVAAGHPDAPVGVVGMNVSEASHAGMQNVIEYTAIGTAVAHTRDGDPRKAASPPAPQIVVPLDR